ncbi:MAG TPA: hypothetical protein VL442_03015 [Mucilaginibacter sp.]|jgi:hypothetical protein|nr:hypothetical protein [Mucilaginibacter sp.]
MGILTENVINVFKQASSAFWIAACDTEGKPLVVRVSGVELRDDDTVCSYVPMKFGSELQSKLVSGLPVSLLAASTINFESYQLKGNCVSIDNATSDATTRQMNNLQAFADCTAVLGLSAELCYRAYADEHFLAIEVKLHSVFDQSPKNNAGLKLNC